MALSDMKVFDKYVADATIETLGQMVEKFNGASAGAIQLTTQGFSGDFLHETMWKSIHSAQRRVDRYAAAADVIATPMTQIEQTGVKIAGGFGPVSWEPSQLTWMMTNEAEAIEMASRNLAEAIMKDQLNTAIAALCGAIGNVAAVTLSSADALSYAKLNSTHALFGDRSASIVADVITGATYHALIGQNITNANELFRAEGVTIVDILGKAVIVTDAPALSTKKALGLVAGAAVVHDGGDLITNTQVANGKTRISATFQADYTFGLALKGYAWDTANGGKSPTDAEIATGTNWDQYVSEIKDTAGVIAVVSA